MKKLTLIALIMPFLWLFNQSCKKDKTESSQTTQVQFEFSVSNSNAFKSALTDSGYIEGLTAVVVTIEDLKGNIIKNSEKVDLYNMNGYYISKPLPLVVGEFKLTHFLVLNSDNNIVYASPLEGSPKAYLVSTPLPISFGTSKDNVTKLQPEVLSTADCSPEDFGYASFGLNISQTFDFLVGVFLYDETAQNFGLTTANISILSDTTKVYTGELSATSVDSSALSGYDKTAVTNKITLPERYNSYTIIISKAGYKTYQQTFTKEDLRLYYRSEDNGPLVVILDRTSLLDGLVAYYKFDGDVLDYSGFGNNGVYSGNGSYGTGLQNEPQTAVDFNGSTDYIKVKNSPSTNPKNQISVCAWYYSVPFYGNGSNAIVSKAILDGNTVVYQYHLAVSGNQYTNPAGVGFGVSTTSGFHGINTTGYGGGFEFTYFRYDLYRWYFLCGIYDGEMVKLYIDGVLYAYMKTDGQMIDLNTELSIGKSLLDRPYNDYLAGKLDEVRIYNRALTQDEILSLYQQQ